MTDLSPHLQGTEAVFKSLRLCGPWVIYRICNIFITSQDHNFWSERVNLLRIMRIRHQLHCHHIALVDMQSCSEQDLLHNHCIRALEFPQNGPTDINVKGMGYGRACPGTARTNARESRRTNKQYLLRAHRTILVCFLHLQTRKFHTPQEDSGIELTC